MKNEKVCIVVLRVAQYSFLLVQNLILEPDGRVLIKHFQEQ